MRPYGATCSVDRRWMHPSHRWPKGRRAHAKIVRAERKHERQSERSLIAEEDLNMKQLKRPRRKLKRSIHIDADEWTYQVGSSITFIRSPDLTRTWRRRTCEVAGLTPEDYERDMWKGNFKGVTPQMVKDHILETIVPEYHRGIRSSGGAAKTGFAFSGEIEGVR